jgi:hypothetical protein
MSFCDSVTQFVSVLSCTVCEQHCIQLQNKEGGWHIHSIQSPELHTASVRTGSAHFCLPRGRGASYLVMN